MNVNKALNELIEFIETNDVQDEYSNDGDGMFDMWRSAEFTLLIEQGKSALAEAESATKLKD